MHVQALAPDRDSASAIAACHGHLVAQRDLYKAAHELVPGQRLDSLRDATSRPTRKGVSTGWWGPTSM